MLVFASKKDEVFPIRVVKKRGPRDKSENKRSFKRVLTKNRHKTLSLKVTYIEFDCTMQVVTHTPKIKMMPYNSVEMINLTLSFNVLLPRGTLMLKTLHQS